ncbi:MAG: ubiquinone biosynthesis hydroxylase [Rhizobiales bacterium]|nr:ubiquinone biosynthesis hydroxylase [Hyphomicrobiales bacterium]MBO6699527.1 ubiquinone biosynthesis hydroxylase [Hyphomicrobiales bacterium]MBO6737065.1 ubiquinone biosynthesis hydroxylase [Hyphomicrobiales bacterium]MBO6911861.1 ubiquinone biosynthesis hydroxylase [Hyphomicrobiales bacterium]MBO6954798.1 ubiquinone biosynthesis hydroxylase [Hyphomicrobiales bacterium]
MARASLSTVPETVDVLIAGGGYVGLSLALALKVGAKDLTVAVVDLREPAQADKDGRASAIASAARTMLTTLGAWQGFAEEAQPINQMIITDSETRDPVRPVFLTFDGETKDGEPFAHMVPNGAMTKSLRARCLDEGVIIEAPQTVDDFDADTGHVDITLGDKRQVTARLLVACDGVRSRLRDLAGIDTVGWMYGQSGIVCTVSHKRDHEGIAYEHFLPAGPFASLPLPGKRSSIVWTEKTATADALVNGDEFTFMLELERRFGAQFGELKLESRRIAFPLGLKLARSFIAPRLALAGDSAHGMHPIAGQGLNMGLRDVAALAEAVVDAARLGLDIGADDVLERYQRWRRFDTAQMGVVTDVLNRLFSNDMAPVRTLRSFGLGVVDRLPALKRYFIDEAAGISKDRPRLMSGEAI